MTLVSLHIDGQTFEPGTTVYVQPGLVHRWQRALLAGPVPQPEPIRSVRVIRNVGDFSR